MMKKIQKIKVIPVLSILALLVFVIGFGFVEYMSRRMEKTMGVKNNTVYERHYVMIAENMKDGFWQSVYSSARTYAASEDIYLESLSDKISEDASLSEQIDISISQDVDGIIICPDGSDEVNDAIDKAMAYGIPVVTVYSDAPDTDRVSFVGINTYQLGKTYADETMKIIRGGMKKITVLLEENQGTTGNEIFSQIKSGIMSGAGAVMDLSVEPYYIENDSAFDTEEAIRNIFVDRDELPDIVVALTETDSECAYQAAIDYNQVGNVQILGCFVSDIILKGIEKGIIEKTVRLNTSQLGQNSVEALEQYLNDGNVSDYFSVDLDVISADNLEDMYEKQDY